MRTFSRRILPCVSFGLIFVCSLSGIIQAQTSPIVFSTNAGYCWYQDERAIIDNNQLIFSQRALSQRR